MQTNVLRRVDFEAEQVELALARKAHAVEVSIEVVRSQKSAAAAFTLACSLSGLEDKEIYLVLGIDAGQFSRIKKGQAGFDPGLIANFCHLVENTVYPEWIAYQLGCTLVMIESEAERRARQAEERFKAADAENRLMRQLLQGRAS